MSFHHFGPRRETKMLIDMPVFMCVVSALSIQSKIEEEERLEDMCCIAEGVRRKVKAVAV